MLKILLYFLEYIYTLLVNNLIEQSALFVGLYALSINGVFNFKLLEVGIFLTFTQIGNKAHLECTCYNRCRNSKHGKLQNVNLI